MESELVSGFMTEHSAVIFVFFFLAEYASIVLICILTSILFLGGYNLDIAFLSSIAGSIYSALIFSLEICIYGYKVILTLFSNIGENGISDLFTLIKHIEVNDSVYNKENLEIINAVNRILGINNDVNSNFDVNNGINKQFLSDPKIEGLLYSLSLGIKTFIMIFVFIWVRASFPRIRFDQLMSYCWTVLLPIVFAFVVLIPCILYIFEIIPSNFLYY